MVIITAAKDFFLNYKKIKEAMFLLLQIIFKTKYKYVYKKYIID